MPRLKAWTEYTRSHPPVHMMVASYLGIRPIAKLQDTALANEEAAAFLLGLPELGRK